MSYRQALNMAQSLSVGNRVDLIRELDTLRAELDDIRTEYAALLAKLDADSGVGDTDYASTLALPAAKFTAV